MRLRLKALAAADAKAGTGARCRGAAPGGARAARRPGAPRAAHVDVLAATRADDRRRARCQGGAGARAAVSCLRRRAGQAAGRRDAVARRPRGGAGRPGQAAPAARRSCPALQAEVREMSTPLRPRDHRRLRAPGGHHHPRPGRSSRPALMDESDALLKANLARSHSPYYLMSDLADNAKKRGDKAAALRLVGAGLRQERRHGDAAAMGRQPPAPLVELAPQGRGAHRGAWRRS